MTTEPMWEGADQRVIESELARCVLGGGERTELRMDFPGQFARQALAVGYFAQSVGEALLPALTRAAAAIASLAEAARHTPLYGPSRPRHR